MKKFVNRPSLYIFAFGIALSLASCSTSTSTANSTNNNTNTTPPDTVYPYLTSSPTFARSTVSLQGSVYTVCTTTMAVTKNTVYASVVLGQKVTGPGAKGSYGSAVMAVPYGSLAITVVDTLNANPPGGEYYPQIMLSTETNGNDFTPTTNYWYNSSLSTTAFTQNRYQHFLAVDTTLSTWSVPSVQLP